MNRTIDPRLHAPIEPNDLYIFAVIVEAGSFTAAGKILGFPKSRLSRRIAELEANLGVRLLQRTTRRMTLTEIGHEVWEHAQTMRLAVHAARDQGLAGSATPRGKVRVAAPVLLGQMVLPDLVASFMRSHPEVTLEIELTNRSVDLIAEGFDIAIEVVAREHAVSTVIRRSLARTRPILVASPDLVHRLGAPASIHDLARFPALMLFSPDRRYSLEFTGPKGASAQVNVRPSLACSDLMIMVAAAIGGVGVAMLPKLLCGPAIRAGQLQHLLPAWKGPTLEIQVFYPSRKGRTLAARTLLDFLSKAIPPRLDPVVDDPVEET